MNRNAGGATIKQTAVAANFAAPSISGAIRFGAGSDVLDIAEGRQNCLIIAGISN